MSENQNLSETLLVTAQNQYTKRGLRGSKKAYDKMTEMGLIVKMHKITTKGSKKNHIFMDKIYEKEGKTIVALNKHTSNYNTYSNAMCVVTGDLHGGYIGIDIDVKKPKGGMTNVKYLLMLMAHDVLNDTLTCKTPSGGYHYVYKLTQHQQSRLRFWVGNGEMKLFDSDIDVLYNTGRFVMHGAYMCNEEEYTYKITSFAKPMTLPDVVFQEILRRIPNGGLTSFKFGGLSMYRSNKCEKFNIECESICIHCKNIFCSQNMGGMYDAWGMGSCKYVCHYCYSVLRDDESGLVSEYCEMKFDSTFKKDTEIIQMKDIQAVTELDEKIHIHGTGLENYLKCLSPFRCSEYGEWFRIGAIIHNSGGTYELFDKWSQQCAEKYDKVGCTKTWNTYGKASSKKAGMPKLMELAGKDNPKLYQQTNIYLYLQIRKDVFAGNELTVRNIINKNNTCFVELDDEYCPFAKCKHDTKSIYLEVSKKGLIMKCNKCLGEQINTFISNNALSKYFGVDVTKESIQNPKLTHSDDILLMNESKYVQNKIVVDEKYISKNSIDKMKEYDTIIMLSPTGSGKSTAQNAFLKEFGDDDKKVLSIISRRSMAATHIKAFERSNMTSYLDESENQNKDRYIISLEQLYRVDVDYDILLLDEVTSLILHLYSPTMKKARLKSFITLVQLIKKCKKIVLCDAIITDMVLEFIAALRSDTAVVYYKNTYKNKQGVNMKINTRKNNPIAKELELFCKPIIDLVKKNKSVLIMSDSKSIVNDVYYHLSKHQTKDYFKIYTKDSGSFTEFVNCNDLWKNKCVIFSPKIIYGLDVTIEYEYVFAIYRGNTIDSFSMLQQVSRARNVRNVNILFLLKHYDETKNKFVNYDKNKYLEELELHKFLTDAKAKYGNDNMDKFKDNILFELQSMVMSGFDDNILHEINENSLFGKIHLYASWYRRLFNYNKSQLFIQLCKNQGYLIKKKSYVKDGTKANFENVKEIILEEVVKQTEKIIMNDDTKTDDLIDIENRKEIIKEDLKSRMKILRIDELCLIDNEELRDIVKNTDRFNRCIKSIILYYTKENVDNKAMTDFAKNFSFIEKSGRLFKIITIIQWLEKALGVNRFEFAKIKVDDIDVLVKNMLKELDMFQWLIQSSSGLVRKDNIEKRIKKLTTECKIIKFCADIINQFDNFYTYETKRKGRDKHYVYMDFKCNDDIIENHALIINCIGINRSKFMNPMKKKILEDISNEDIEFLEDID